MENLLLQSLLKIYFRRLQIKRSHMTFFYTFYLFWCVFWSENQVCMCASWSYFLYYMQLCFSWNKTFAWVHLKRVLVTSGLEEEFLTMSACNFVQLCNFGPNCAFEFATPDTEQCRDVAVGNVCKLWHHFLLRLSLHFISRSLEQLQPPPSCRWGVGGPRCLLGSHLHLDELLNIHKHVPVLHLPLPVGWNDGLLPGEMKRWQREQ